MSDELNLDEIEALANAATPGPWEVDGFPGRTPMLVANGFDVICLFQDHPRIRDKHIKPNAELIANARTDIPALCAELRDHRGADRDYGEVRDLYDNLRQQFNELRAENADLRKTAGAMIDAAYPAIQAAGDDTHYCNSCKELKRQLEAEKTNSAMIGEALDGLPAEIDEATDRVEKAEAQLAELRQMTKPGVCKYPDVCDPGMGERCIACEWTMKLAAFNAKWEAT